MKEFNALVRIDTPQEVQYYQHGGILQYVLRQLIASKPKPETSQVELGKPFPLDWRR